MLAHRLRRWPNSKPTQTQRPVFLLASRSPVGHRANTKHLHNMYTTPAQRLSTLGRRCINAIQMLLGWPEKVRRYVATGC